MKNAQIVLVSVHVLLASLVTSVTLVILITMVLQPQVVQLVLAPPQELHYVTL